MKRKQIVSLGLAAVMALGALGTVGCGNKKSSDSGKDAFSWWIVDADGEGLYDSYDDNPSIQWLNQQTWDVEKQTIAEGDSGNPLHFTFRTPIAGEEANNFNTMLGTGEYTDVLDLAYSSDNAKTLYEEGVALDLTEYVEKYCPNYVAFLEENPELKPLVTYQDEDGNTKYYSMYSFNDGTSAPWYGYIYRRDWVVKYCQPTDYVWDWDSAQVKENGHPAVTPLSEAKKQNNLEGWKANDVKAFEVINDGGEKPRESAAYEDNVIFPSGKTEPYTISDWEWMFEGFQKAIKDRGWENDKDAYCTSVYYPGFLQTGDLVSSFGEATNGNWARDEEGNVAFTATTDAFKTYLTAMSTWYKNGWLDQAFTERGGDMFFEINMNGFTTGKVGLWSGYASNLADGIRLTCLNEEDAKDAYCMPCQYPINDMYGTDEQKFVTPNAMYQNGRVGGQVVITEKAKDKDLPALFTFFNWLFTEDGKATRFLGLTKEKLESADLKEGNTYEINNLTEGSYTLETDADGKKVYRLNYDPGTNIGGTLSFGRLGVGITMTGLGEDLDYTLEKNQKPIEKQAEETWGRYTSTSNLMDFASQLSSDDAKKLGDVSAPLNDYLFQTVPNLIKNDLEGWDAYVEKVNSFGVDEISEMYEKYTK